MKIHHDTAINLLYLSGSEHRNGLSEIILPVTITKTISPKEIFAVFESVKDPNDHSSRPKSVILGVLASDSTNVYYRIFDGIKGPSEHLVMASIEATAND